MNGNKFRSTSFKFGSNKFSDLSTYKKDYPPKEAVPL